MSLTIRLLLLGLVLMVSSCSTEDGCYGYWEDMGLKRGTVDRNKFYVNPYRQCVEEVFPHKNIWKRRR